LADIDGGLPVGDADGGSGPRLPGGCAEGTQFIYTLAEDNTLYKFYPPSLQFTAVGTVNCDLSGPWSMAVDRSAQIWSVWGDGHLFQINASTAACTPTAYSTGQHGFTTFGMGFAANTAGSQDETLFVSDDTAGLGLASINTTSFVLTPLGAYTNVTFSTTGRAELTGTGNGNLYGAFEGSPFTVAEINKTNAALLSAAPQTGISTGSSGGSNFAFAAWGGGFYLFVGPGTSTDVYFYDPTTQTTTMKTSVTFEIVGAGVSTCAPLE
jgi:hypothetical protein